jgi:hypothetical protein
MCVRACVCVPISEWVPARGTSSRRGLTSSSQMPPLVQEVAPFLNTYMSRMEEKYWSWIPTGLEIKNYCFSEDQQQFNRLTVFCSEKESVRISDILIIVVTIYRRSVNPLTNPNPVSKHWHVTIYYFNVELIKKIGVPWKYLVICRRVLFIRHRYPT